MAMWMLVVMMTSLTTGISFTLSKLLVENPWVQEAVEHCRPPLLLMKCKRPQTLLSQSSAGLMAIFKQDL